MPVTVRTLGEAQQLAGLEFTLAQRQQALGAFEGFLAGYQSIRASSLANGEAPATRFDPRLPSVTYDAGDGTFVRGPARAPRLPADDEDIAYAPVAWLSHWIERGQLSSERLTSIYLRRLKRYDRNLHCIVTLLEEPALEAARRADAEIVAGRYRGPLHGIPWGAKDLLDTAGVPTTWGAAPFRDRVPDRDAAVVRRLEEAGAILVAKLTLGALANGDVWFGGRTRNPWNRRQGSSGSSAGSASAVAAGLVGFAIGTETLGSIVSPSSICGTVGLRPTFGRVSRAGAMALCWSMDKIGPITRTVEDAALVLDAIAGPDAKDESMPDASVIDMPLTYDGRKRSVRGRRVGYIAAAFRGNQADATQRRALRALRDAGVEVVPIQAPPTEARGLRSILWCEAAAAFDELTRSGSDAELTRQDDDAWPNLFRRARFIPAVELVQADRLRRRVMAELHELFERRHLDALISPSIPTGPHDPFLPLTNFTGHPSLSLRSGIDRKRLPTGVTLWGRLFEEGALLRLGAALERSLDVWHRRPPLPPL
jgi:Asp-tRNA(Asn)/Glu-tRNA(Gln) amidotransferase A subunit family amidase